MPRLEEARKLWCDFYGFEPAAVASFDHMGVGLLSRIPVGYERLTARTNGSPNVVSIVLDTIRPASERQCGVSMEIGFLPHKRTTFVADPDSMFFKNQVRPDFHIINEVGVRLNEFLTSKLPRRQREVTVGVIGARLMTAMNALYSKTRTCGDMVEGRRVLMEEELHLTRFAGKRVLASEMLPTIAATFEELLRNGINLNDTPYADKYGYARYLTEDGHEEELVSHDPNWAEIITRVSVGRALPTAPFLLLATVVAPDFDHFGNDYGLLEALNTWFGTTSGNLAGGDDKDSWPVGNIVRDKRNHTNTVLDLMHFPWELYAEMVRTSSNGNGAPVFERKFGDFMVI